MDLLFTVLVAVTIFGTIVFVHEGRHFLAARLVGIRVVTFSLGFGPRLWTKRLGDTTFCLSAVPLGGYVLAASGPQGDGVHKDPPVVVRWLAPLGPDEVALAEELATASEGTMAQASFAQKLFFLINGLVANVLFAYCLYVVAFFHFGVVESYAPESRVGTVRADSPAARAGLKTGDLVVSLNDKPGTQWSNWRQTFRDYRGEALRLLVLRDVKGSSQNVDVTFTPVKMTATGSSQARWDYGFTSATRKRRITVLESFRFAAGGLVEIATGFVKVTLGLQPPPKDSDSDAEQVSSSWGVVGGFLEIGTFGARSLRHFCAMFVGLTVVIVILNSIPYPAFDGGQILLLLIERMRGKELSVALKHRLSCFGLASSLLVLVLALGNDLLTTVTRLF